MNPKPESVDEALKQRAELFATRVLTESRPCLPLSNLSDDERAQLEEVFAKMVGAAWQVGYACALDDAQSPARARRYRR